MLQVDVQALPHVCYCSFKPHKGLCKGSPPRCRQVDCVIDKFNPLMARILNLG
jgi:hypothetical protein